MTNQMTDQHLIIPPEELVGKWVDEYHLAKVKHHNLVIYIAGKAAQWGADAELDACCEWMQKRGLHPEYWRDLRDARRPKPPIKADQALAVLNTAPKAGTPTVILDIDQFDTILLALKRMKELEKPNE